jgi:predicted acetyltransferase
VPTALSGRSYNGANGSLVLQIADADVPGNDGTWQVAFDDGLATVTPAPGAAPDLSCDISVLASIWSGALSVSTAWRWGRLQIGDESLLPLLDDAFRTVCAPFMPDYDTF